MQIGAPLIGAAGEFLGIAEGSIDPCGLRLSPSSWYVEWRCFRIYYGRDRSDGLITDQETALVNALRGAMIWASMPGEALYFHGATLVYRDQAILLVGRPNAGKSTIGREGRADSVLCDEISILQRRPDGWWALPSPFWGSQGGTRMAEPARLGAIAVLGQDSERNRWEPLHGRHVLPSLMPHLACQASAHFEDPRLLGTVGELANGLPVFSFEWHRASHPSRRMPMDPIVRGSADGVES